MSKFVTLSEAAEQLGISQEEVNELRLRGDLYGYRDGTSWKFKARGYCTHRRETVRLVERRSVGRIPDRGLARYQRRTDRFGDRSGRHRCLVRRNGVVE